MFLATPEEVEDFRKVNERLFDLTPPACAFCSVSYNLKHNPKMSAKELGIENFLDDGDSWAEGWLRRDEFKDICICHAVHFEDSAKERFADLNFPNNQYI